MKKLGIYTVVTALLTVGTIASANAQSKFEGAYGQIGIGYENITPTFNSSGLNIIGVGAAPISTNVSSQGSVMGVVTIGYMAPITKDFLLGIGAEYNPFNSQSGNYNYGVSNVRVNGTYQSQNQYNIFLSPATPVGTDGLLYGKVGYTGASVKATEGGVSNTQNLTGYSLGLGYKQIIQGGLYGFGEVNYMGYGNHTNSYSGVAGGYTYSYSLTSSANVFNAVVGIGYKF
ncbi:MULTISPECIES: outer membrane beta-barrel protein [unclassified Polynucleobacter]|uniref:outer membrane beta-barrel protein n=1 Tax=unclassified Polynucleobacter TaxID=2640945 RepID=UPI0008C2D6C4|nr:MULTISPECIES: outer membrane beta-barrel protein [unclassified Polynucleobacter]OHC10321.1 MAG: hypothetical protein A2X74_00285 [Polynucleobacter sp. GWA2_45_21]HBK44149.1 hypothetical protein [Polynucleobacter sp.]